MAGLQQGPGKCFWGTGKVLKFFVTKRSGTLNYTINAHIETNYSGLIIYNTINKSNTLTTYIVVVMEQGTKHHKCRRQFYKLP